MGTHVLAGIDTVDGGVDIGNPPQAQVHLQHVTYPLRLSRLD